MDFAYSAAHQMTRKMVRQFAEAEIAPHIKEHDRAVL
jgi:alkylation response protein AidB-like acyl-CoA dehydrogenase